jgi:hypothetical protein
LRAILCPPDRIGKAVETLELSDRHGEEPLSPSTLGDVSRDLGGTAYFAVGVLHRRDGERDVHETAILGAPYRLEVIHTFDPTNACEHVLLFVEAVFFNNRNHARRRSRVRRFRQGRSGADIDG